MGPRRRRAPLGAARLAAVAVAAGAVLAPGAARGASSQRAVPAEVAAAAVPLASTEPGAAGSPSSDLAALAGWLGDSRVVGLGEGAHGTHTLHRLTHRIFAHLAAEAGFDVLALEIDQAHAARLDAWVQGERDDLDAILAERWWGSGIFYGEATVELLRWMRERNRAGGRRLHVAGFDLKQPRLAAHDVVRSLAPLDAGAARRVAALYEEALRPGGFGGAPNNWGYTGILRVPLPERATPAQVTVEAEVRAEGVTHGSVGLGWVLDRDRFSPSWLEGEPPGPAWRTLRREVEVPAGAEPLELVVWHRGNGTFEITAPVVTSADRAVPVDLSAIEVRPLMAPKLQVMDHRAALLAGGRGGRPVLRITADSGLDAAREAAAAAESLVRGTVERDGERTEPRVRAWLPQAARLVTQAVAWRTLVEPNRDVFLAENILWLARSAFPGSRILALAHASHSERRAGRMGAFLARELAGDYRTVSMLPGSGQARDLGPVAELEAGAALELVPVAAGGPRDPLGAALPGVRSGDFLLPLEALAATEPGERWLGAVHPRPAEAPDVAIRVERVDALRPHRRR